jgi:hypothetical protein
MPNQDSSRKQKRPRARAVKRTPPRPAGPSPITWVLTLGALGLGGYWVVTRDAGPVAQQPQASTSVAAERPSPAATATDPARQPAVAGWKSSWDPLPGRAPPGPEGEAIVEAYTFAANNPEIVQHIPCFCGCSQRGHKSVESCFVTERLPDGKPRWNPMGFG